MNRQRRKTTLNTYTVGPSEPKCFNYTCFFEEKNVDIIMTHNCDNSASGNEKQSWKSVTLSINTTVS